MSNVKIRKFPVSFLQFKHLFWIEPFNNRLDGDYFDPIAESEVEVEFCRIKNIKYIHFFSLPCWYDYGVYFPISMYWRKKTRDAIMKLEKETGNKKEAEKKILAKIKKEFVKDLNITKAWAIKVRDAYDFDEQKGDRVLLEFMHDISLKIKKNADK